MALTVDMARAEADALLAERGSAAVTLRSCWECNAAHEHLKDRDAAIVIACFACGRWFYRGVDITAPAE